jgi:hypothetical protein
LIETVLDQFGTNFGVIVNFTIEGEPQGPIRIAHGLCGGFRQIDDGQAPVPEPDFAILRDPGSATIGTPMDHGVSHSIEVGLGYFIRTAGERERSDDAAHESGQRLEVEEMSLNEESQVYGINIAYAEM